jgi:S1-C subfamily serine protease
MGTNRRRLICYQSGSRLAVLLYVAMISFGCGPKPETVPLSDPSVASLGKAATVLIVNNISAQVSVPNISFNVPAIVAAGRDIATPDMAPQQIMDAVWTKVFQNPADYLTTSDGESETKTAVARGSGFFVTSDGVLVTNAHVVEAADDELKKLFAAQGLKDKISDKLSGMLGGLNAEDRHFTDVWLSNEANAKLAVQGIINFLAPRVQVTDEKAELGVVDVSGEAGTLEKPQLMSAHTLPGGLGSSKDEDVAILKVDGAGFHTLGLESNEPQIEDTVFAVGFPGDSTFSAAFDQKERPVATVTDGKVNAVKPMSNGAYSAIQMSATIHPGNSGGPVLDRLGRVVGISTFGLNDSEGHEISGTDFALPISVAKRYLGLAGVTPAESETTYHYRRALALEQTSHYVKARTELEAVLRDRPTDATALKELDRVGNQIRDGQDKSYLDYLPMAAGGGIGCFVALCAGVGVLRKRRRTTKGTPLQRAPAIPNRPTVGPRFKLLVQGKMVPLVVGATVTDEELPFLQSAEGGVVATVVHQSNGVSVVGIRNDSTDSWEATSPDGHSHILAPGEVVTLAPGLRISFGAAQGVVHG